MEVSKTQEELDKEIQITTDKKRNAWGNLGVSIFLQEMQLQARAVKACAKFIIPTKIEECPAAEAALKEGKADQNAIVKDRKEITSRLYDVSTRLMMPEKSIDEPYKTSYNSILAVKSAHAKAEQAKKDKIEEIKKMREGIGQYLSQADSNACNLINSTVSKAYEAALTTKNVKPEDITAYIDACKTGLKADTFNLVAPMFTLKLIEPTEAEFILEEEFKWNAQEYINIYHNELDLKFSDYHVAFANKEEALALSLKETEDKKALIDSEKESKDIAASLSASSSTLNFDASNVTTPVKDLKKSFAIDMEENAENAIHIMRAFVGNFKACNEKLKITKWFAITPGQMATALAKIKSDDNNFQPQNINFKVVEKL